MQIEDPEVLDLDFHVDTDHTSEYFEYQLTRLLEDAVRIQLRADVPVAHTERRSGFLHVTCLALRCWTTPSILFQVASRKAPATMKRVTRAWRPNRPAASITRFSRPSRISWTSCRPDLCHGRAAAARRIPRS
jgi:hypothetical protein